MVELLATLLLCLQPVEAARVERVDRVMLHHFYNDMGEPVWQQAIFYDWNGKVSHYDVRAWRIVKQPGQVPYYDHRRRVWTAIWFDGDILRHIEACSFEVFHSQYDPELEERDYLPPDQRRELRK